MRLATKEITARTKNTNSNMRPISIETPAIPEAPSSKATRARTKNKIDALNIFYSFLRAHSVTELESNGDAKGAGGYGLFVKMTPCACEEKFPVIAWAGTRETTYI
jgi:hypothetical protein